MSDRATAFLEALGYSEEPFGMFYTDTEPESGFVPKEGAAFSYEMEQRGEVELFSAFSELVVRDWKHMACPKEKVRRLFRSQALRMHGRFILPGLPQAAARIHCALRLNRHPGPVPWRTIPPLAGGKEENSPEPADMGRIAMPLQNRKP